MPTTLVTDSSPNATRCGAGGGESFITRFWRQADKDAWVAAALLDADQTARRTLSLPYSRDRGQALLSQVKHSADLHQIVQKEARPAPDLPAGMTTRQALKAAPRTSIFAYAGRRIYTMMD